MVQRASALAKRVSQYDREMRLAPLATAAGPKAPALANVAIIVSWFGGRQEEALDYPTAQQGSSK